ncbi:ATP citrate (Pro-S)-lyase [Puccinia sorghi]|uniref:ATP citrate synthase n=1 Tax=Puccinia sorghi TaxID=27349 RepID=A0A0L6V494_9BASI|nr:ATP citrate (Pro-S)-lyase [Puccinia sorghi]
MSHGVHSSPNFTPVAVKASDINTTPSHASPENFAANVVPESREEHGVVSFAQGAPAEHPWFSMIYPFSSHKVQKFYWGTKETLLPVYATIADAVKKHPEADTLVNFSSSRSVYQSTLDALEIPQIKSIALIAEGVPERHAREILHLAQKKKVIIIGPATVGGIKPGCFRIGNTGGMMDNIISSKLYRPGSVAYVSKSGGMSSNELNNILSLTTNGTYKGIAIGGNCYPGTTFIDHMLRYKADPNCKMLVQFGNAGSMANLDLKAADAKNKAMQAAGFVVPNTFLDLPEALKKV